MSAFKDMVARDIHTTFLNVDEFGEKRTVIYDGERYEDIPVVLDEVVQDSRTQMEDDHVQGLYQATDLLFCALSDLGWNRPEKGQKLLINDEEGSGGFFHPYYVAKSTTENGLLKVWLEAIDE